jgi:hypothetical protein
VKRLRLVMPATLAGVGVYLLVGCIYIPTFNGVKTGKNYSKLVGDAKSRKPVRVGRSTVEDALRILGVPFSRKGDGEALAYTWTVQTGVAVWPLCFHAESMQGYRTLVLRFDANRRLASYEILKTNEPFLDFGGTSQPMPRDFTNHGEQGVATPGARPTTTQ